MAASLLDPGERAETEAELLEVVELAPDPDLWTEAEAWANRGIGRDEEERAEAEAEEAANRLCWPDSD
mgnify:CR=1 FL=1